MANICVLLLEVVQNAELQRENCERKFSEEQHIQSHLGKKKNSDWTRDETQGI